MTDHCPHCNKPLGAQRMTREQLDHAIQCAIEANSMISPGGGVKNGHSRNAHVRSAMPALLAAARQMFNELYPEKPT